MSSWQLKSAGARGSGGAFTSTLPCFFPLCFLAGLGSTITGGAQLLDAGEGDLASFISTKNDRHRGATRRNARVLSNW